MSLDRIDCVVIGAGVVGLAVARAMALAGHQVLIAERAGHIGSETSSRNSEVVHAGIYYAAGSLKAKHCVAGRRALYQFCDEMHVPYRRCGKLIVASNEAQMGLIDNLRQKGLANDVEDLVLISRNQALTMESELSCIGAMHSPVTGIVDSHAFMLALLGQAEENGASIAYMNRLEKAEYEQDGTVLHFVSCDESNGRFSIKADLVVNTAGHDAVPVAKSIQGLDLAHIPERRFAKGNYFSLVGRVPFSRLIYPVPEAAGLGIHFTLDLGGQGRFGPDVEWVDEINYDVDIERSAKFYAEIRKYYPALKDGALAADYAGIRPKIVFEGEVLTDFMISGPQDHGLKGIINLFGIESPGLTAALSIADDVVSRF